MEKCKGNKINDYNPIGIRSDTLIVEKGLLYFNGLRVMPEFYSLVWVPFSHHLTFRYRKSLKNPDRQAERRIFLNSHINALNRLIRKSHPLIVSGNRTVNYVSVVEYGGAERDCHLHCLLHIHGEAPSSVYHQVQDYIESWKLAGEKEVESMFSIVTHENSGLISYFCKCEQGMDREFKEFDYSIGFLRKITKFYPPKIQDLPSRVIGGSPCI